MKKLFIFLSVLMVSAALSAQTMVAPTYTIEGQGTKGATLTPVAASTATPANATVAATYYVYKINSLAPYYYAYTVRLFDDTGSNTASVVIAASSEGTYWKTITTVSYTGVGSDTAIIGAVSTAVPYNYIRFSVTPSDSIWVTQHSLTVKPIAR